MQQNAELNVTSIGFPQNAVSSLVGAILNQEVIWVKGTNLREFDLEEYRYRVHTDIHGNLSQIELIAKIMVPEYVAPGSSSDAVSIVHDFEKERNGTENPEFGSW